MTHSSFSFPIYMLTLPTVYRLSEPHISKNLGFSPTLTQHRKLVRLAEGWGGGGSVCVCVGGGGGG